MLSKKLFVILSNAKYLFNAVLRSFTFVQDDKFAKEKVNLDNCYIISKIYSNTNIVTFFIKKRVEAGFNSF